MNDEWSDADLAMLERIQQLGDEMHSDRLPAETRRRSRAEFERLVQLVLEKGTPPLAPRAASEEEDRR
jgi:hypothetical protein